MGDDLSKARNFIPNMYFFALKSYGVKEDKNMRKIWLILFIWKMLIHVHISSFAPYNKRMKVSCGEEQI